MRTVENFAEDLAMRGRNNQQIRAVSLCTRWADEIDKIEQLLAKYGKRWRKIGAEIRFKARLAKNIRFRVHAENPIKRRVLKIRKKKIFKILKKK